jgi:hypothetical protein
MPSKSKKYLKSKTMKKRRQTNKKRGGDIFDPSTWFQTDPVKKIQDLEAKKKECITDYDSQIKKIQDNMQKTAEATGQVQPAPPAAPAVQPPAPLPPAAPPQRQEAQFPGGKKKYNKK